MDGENNKVSKPALILDRPKRNPPSASHLGQNFPLEVRPQTFLEACNVVFVGEACSLPHCPPLGCKWRVADGYKMRKGRG